MAATIPATDLAVGHQSINPDGEVVYQVIAVRRATKADAARLGEGIDKGDVLIDVVWADGGAASRFYKADATARVADDAERSAHLDQLAKAWA